MKELDLVPVKICQSLSTNVRFRVRWHFGQANFWFLWHWTWKHDWQTKITKDFYL